MDMAKLAQLVLLRGTTSAELNFPSMASAIRRDVL
jgi:hypothetical protein